MILVLPLTGAVVVWLVLLAALRHRAVLSRAIVWWDAPRLVTTFRDPLGVDRAFTDEYIFRSQVLRELSTRATRISR